MRHFTQPLKLKSCTAWLMLVLSLTACGRGGPLYLPQVQSAPATSTVQPTPVAPTSDHVKK